MPLATPAQYAELLDAAVNVSSSTTLNAAILGFVTAGFERNVQVSRGGGEFAAGDRVLGARALADYAAVDAQYVYTRAVADHMFVNYAGVVRADCGIGDKRAYDPRTCGRSAEQAMAAGVVEVCHQLGSAARSLTGHAPRPRRA